MDVLSSRILVRPTDLDRSLRFYRDVLGLAVYREFGPPDHPGVVFFLGQGLLEVSGQVPGPPQRSVMIWIQVRNLHQEHARLAAAGVPVIREPVTEPWGLVEMWIEDPDGTRIVLVEVPAGHPLRRDPRSPLRLCWAAYGVRAGDNMWYRAGVDLVVVVHLLFIGFVVGGAFLAWRWPRIIWAHIPAVIYGALVEFAGFTCPLTLLENHLRQRAGEAGYHGGFIGHYLVKVIYPPGLTRGMQIGLGLVVLLVAIIGYRGFLHRHPPGRFRLEPR